MATELHHYPTTMRKVYQDASNMCFGIVVAEWNPEITGALLDGAVKTLEKHGVFQRIFILRQFLVALNSFMVHR